MTAAAAPLIQQNQIIPNTSPNFTSPVVASASAGNVIGANPTRRAIIFANPGTNTIYLAPAGTAIAIGQGIPLVPGGVWELRADNNNNIQVSCAWQAIAAAGASNNLSILEFI